MSEYRYCVYGLSIISSAQFPALRSCLDQDVNLPTIQISEHICKRRSWPHRELVLEQARHTAHLWLGTDHAGFVLLSKHPLLEVMFCMDLSGSRIDLYVEHSATLHNARAILVHPILLYAASLHGRINLHANVMAFGEKAIALVGHSGAGKSTLSTALWQQGWQVIADDNAALEMTENGIAVHYGVACLKVAAQQLDAFSLQKYSIQALFNGAMGERNAKYYLSTVATQETPPALPIRLAGIYSLEQREADLQSPRMEKISPFHALPLLAMNARGGELHDRTGAVAEFQQLSQLSQRLPIQSLTCPDSYAQLHTVCDALLRDIQAL